MSSKQKTAYALGVSLGYGVGFARSFMTYKKAGAINYSGRGPEYEQERRSLHILGTAQFKTWADGSKQDYAFGSGIFLAGLWFDIEDSERLRAEASLSEYFTETGTQITDVTTVKPIEFSVRGRISEVSNNSWDGWKMQPYTPKTLNEIQSQTFQLMATIGIGNTAWEFSHRSAYVRRAPLVDENETSLMQSLPNSDRYHSNLRQLRATWYLLALNQERIPVNISTPWGSLKNMVITRLEAVRENSPTSSTYDVTFQQQRRVRPIVKTRIGKPQKQGETSGNPLTEKEAANTSFSAINTDETFTGSGTRTQ